MNKLCKDCGKELEKRNKSGFCIDHVRQNIKKTHGMTGTKEYKTWCRMKNRCYNKRDNSYPRYGAVGIIICDNWVNSFEKFYLDIGDAPSEDHSIDRIDSTKGYSSQNCRWATIYEQANNKKSVTIYGGKNLREWDDELGFKHGTMRARIRQYGWSWDKAISTPRFKRGYKFKK